MNKIQLKAVGLISVKFPSPLKIALILSSIKVNKIRMMEKPNAVHSIQVTLNLKSFISRKPIEINKIEIRMGAITGPHQGSGIRKSISHSISDFGH